MLNCKKREKSLKNILLIIMIKKKYKIRSKVFNLLYKKTKHNFNLIYFYKMNNSNFNYLKNLALNDSLSFSLDLVY